MYDVATKIVNGQLTFHYSEGSDRWDWHGFPPDHRPWTGDCSAHDTYVIWCAGGTDPNGLNFMGGYTGTLLTHEEHIALYTQTMRKVGGKLGPFKRLLVKPGDLVVYGAGTGEHTAFVVKGGLNPLTVSMGQEGDPSLVYVSPKRNASFDGRTPVTFLRPDYRVRPGATVVYPPSHEKAPVAPVLPLKPSSPSVGPKTAQTPSQAPFKPIRRGEESARVKRVQKALGLSPNGLYGIRTARAVSRFQKDHGIAQSGIVDEATAKALGC